MPRLGGSPFANAISAFLNCDVLSPSGTWTSCPACRAVPDGSVADRLHKWTVPAGTKVLIGPTAPNFGRPGGATQIFVANPDALR